MPDNIHRNKTNRDSWNILCMWCLSLSLSLPQNNVMPIAESIYYYLSILDYSDDDNSFYIPILIQPESICNIIVIYFCAVIKKYTPTNLCGCWCVDKIGPVDTVCELSIAYHTISIADVSDFYPYSVSGELNFWKQRVSDYTLFRVWKKKEIITATRERVPL